MKRPLSVLYILLLLTIPTELFAKAETSKVMIRGAPQSKLRPQNTGQLRCMDRPRNELFG